MIIQNWKEWVFLKSSASSLVFFTTFYFINGLQEDIYMNASKVVDILYMQFWHECGMFLVAELLNMNVMENKWMFCSWF